MKRLLLILILTFSFQSLSKADDIRDFEIEGFSLGDNLINYMTKKEIINNDEGHYPKNSKFFEVNYTGTKNQYDHILFHVKRKDNNFKIYYIRAVNTVDNKSECTKIKTVIANELKELFPNTYFQEGSQKHYFYKNSTQYISQFSFKIDANQSDHARVECMIFSDKDKKIHGNFPSTLEVIISTEEFNKWLDAQ
jgi:hypothetical protein